MLKRLQLVGFKSFADRTDFDFSPGVTAVVGPNGSGKSNLVDAIKWVLGEQSAKSLRGGEMSDVIFNGSASRRSLGLAEVTLTFDNLRNTLASPLVEIQVTRRVYRSGEGEYLINNQLCRLKDIKDLFLGSGAGADAYSIIEQGRVDVLLQASTKERRSIFEEAAGISRFRARKTETHRKLERVDANLLRLRDITDEVEKQLRSVRLQAAKAQRYKEHTERLRELRIGLGLLEYDGLARQLHTASDGLEQLRQGLQEEMAQAEGRERQLFEAQQALSRLDEAIHGHETRLADARQQLAADSALLGHEGSTAASIEADLERTSLQAIEHARRAATGAEAVASAARDLLEAETAASTRQQDVERLDTAFRATLAHLEHLQKLLRTAKDGHLEGMRQAGQLHNESVGRKADLENLTRERERQRRLSDQAAGTLASLERQLAEMASAEEEMQGRVAGARQALTEAHQERDRLQHLREETVRQGAELRAVRSGLASRIEVLEGLERSYEGMDTGVREVFALRDRDEPGPWRTILGIVADFLNVPREYAPLIDLALGPRASQVIVRDPALLNQGLAARAEAFSGRVSFVPLAPPGSEANPRPNRLLDLSSAMRVRMPGSAEGHPEHSGIVALAEQVITCELPELQDLPGRLLPRTLLVRDLEVARALAAHTSGFRFVTLQGELLEADGTLTVGTHHAEMGLLSRKSELRELREEAARLETRLDEIGCDLAELTRGVAHAEAEIRDRQQELDVLAEQATDLRSRLAQQRERREVLHEEVAVTRSDMDRLEQDIQHLEEECRQARELAAQAAESVRQLQACITQTEASILQHERSRQAQLEASMTAKLAVSQIEERLKALRARTAHLEDEQRQREHLRLQAGHRLGELRQRLEETRLKLLAAGTSYAVSCLDREVAERSLARLGGDRDRLRQEKQQWSEQLQARRQTWQGRQEEVHRRDLEVSELHHQSDTLIGRLREDYQIDLEIVYRESCSVEREAEPDTNDTIAESPPPAPSTIHGSRFRIPDSAAATEEIEELKKKLARLGSVNLDALQELEELEMRSSTLQTQLDDLTAAKKSLEEIIDRINTDSRKLFADTLGVIRGHFQELFRKLFGGGQADIVLEEEEDILEAGIEIIARPPGKELRSISLMSGGEKTMTAVALLLAIFRSKPSPFCILDEVDAALDEANIGRLASVIREFLDRSQFIMITHSKRTMTAADVLYGVTMQESGISKRIAVRFEDWPDDEREPHKTAS